MYGQKASHVYKSRTLMTQSTFKSSTDKLAWQILDWGDMMRDVDLSKDKSGLKSPPELQRSWFVKGHIRFGVISYVLAQWHLRNSLKKDCKWLRAGCRMKTTTTLDLLSEYQIMQNGAFDGYIPIKLRGCFVVIEKNVEKVIVLKDKLKTTQTRVDCSPHDPIIKEEEAKVLLEYKEVVNGESKILYKKEKINWLRDGDKNNAYFHRVIKGIRMANKIISTCNENGNLVEGTYKFWENSSKRVYSQDVGLLALDRDVYKKKLTDEDNEMMISEVTSVEIKEALFDIGDNKSPSLGGYYVVFFNKSWSIVVQEFSKASGLVPSLNKSKVFFGSVPIETQQLILAELPFSLGTLPVRYLGVPLNTKRIRLNDCKQLVDKIIVRDIDIVMNGFLWCGGDLQKEKAKIPILGLQQNVKDYIVWRSNDGSLKKFSTNHAFVVWLAIQRRLFTRDMILIWNHNAGLKFPFSKNCPDSHNHLYFQFDYLKKIWRALKKKTKMVNMPNDWKGIIDAMNMQRKENTIKSVLRRLVMEVAVYFVCQENNKRIFANEKRNVELLMDLISEKIILKLISLEAKASTRVLNVVNEWNVAMDIQRCSAS
ncbi:hypothetical protein Tco_0919635 [Tanacetum coccineum]